MHAPSRLVIVALGVLLVLTQFIQDTEAAPKGRNRKKKVFMRREDSGSNVQRTDDYGQLWYEQSPYYGTNTSFAATNATLVRWIPGGQSFLYQTWLQGDDFTMAIPIYQPGYYTVSLRFAEMVYTEPGKRVFNIYINDFVNTPLVYGYDIFAEAGGYGIEVDREFPIYTTYRNLFIRVQATVGQAMISAVVVRRSVRNITVVNPPIS